MNERPRFYVDIDDVLCETARAFLPLVRDLFARTFDFDDIRYFDLGRSFDLTPAQLAMLMKRLHEDDALEGLEALPGAAETLADWRARGFAVDIVTGRPPQCRNATRRWLSTNGMVYDELVFVDKYGRNGRVDESSGAITLDTLLTRGPYRLAIEDAPETIAFILERTTWPVLVFDRPWNRAPTLRRERCPVARLGTWAELAALKLP